MSAKQLLTWNEQDQIARDAVAYYGNNRTGGRSHEDALQRTVYFLQRNAKVDLAQVDILAAGAAIQWAISNLEEAQEDAQTAYATWRRAGGERFCDADLKRLRLKETRTTTVRAKQTEEVPE
jgi:hypothetical protein